MGRSSWSTLQPGIERVQIPAGSRRLEVRYTGLSLAAADKVRFQIMLDGGGGGWQDVGVRRVAYYDDLQPGDYKFRVRAANNDGLWGPEGEASFVVPPYIWERGWFRAALIAVGVAGSVSLTWRQVRRRYVRERERLELQKQRNELVHLTRVNMLGELSGSLAHELNQPLTAILTNAQAAQRFIDHRPPEIGEVREILSDIVKEDRRAGEIIRRLRLLLKKGEVTRQPVEIHDVVQEVLRLVRSDLVGRNISVATELSDNLPVVQADRVQVQQVLLNLIVNACDAMGASTAGDLSRRLTLRSVPTDGRGVRVSVIDQGSGIGKENLERVFDPFFTTKKHGMGLGLAMCRTIVAAHGGRMWAEDNPDRGATVHFTLSVSGGPS